MKKSSKKLRLHRETLANLDPEALATPRGGIVTSCTYACACPTGCSEEQICMDDKVTLAGREL